MFVALTQVLHLHRAPKHATISVCHSISPVDYFYCLKIMHSVSQVSSHLQAVLGRFLALSFLALSFLALVILWPWSRYVLLH